MTDDETPQDDERYSDLYAVMYDFIEADIDQGTAVLSLLNAALSLTLSAYGPVDTERILRHAIAMLPAVEAQGRGRLQ
jgi:hypothetical protein